MGALPSEAMLTGNCPSCHRSDISCRVVIGMFERLTCRMCADSYKRTPGVQVIVEELSSRQIRRAGGHAP